jgi:hypothetical protein
VVPLNEPDKSATPPKPPAPPPASKPGFNLDALYGWNQTGAPDADATEADLVPLVEADAVPEVIPVGGNRQSIKAQPVQTSPAPPKPTPSGPSLLTRCNAALGSLFLLLFRVCGKLVLSGVRILRQAFTGLLHPLQSAEAIVLYLETRLYTPAALVVGLSILAGGAGLVLWYLDSLTWIHVTRWLPAVAMVPLAAWLCCRLTRSLSFRSLGLLGGGLAAVLSWWFLPTAHGHSLWSARSSLVRSQRELGDLTPGLFARFQEGRADRVALVLEYPQLLKPIRDLEATWVERSIKEETDSIEKRKLTPDGAQERLRRLAQNLTLLAERPLEPDQMTSYRRDLFQLRLDKAKAAAEALVKKNHTQEAYDQVIRPVLADLDSEARDLGLEDVLFQFRDSYGTTAKLDRLATGQSR